MATANPDPRATMYKLRRSLFDDSGDEELDCGEEDTAANYSGQPQNSGNTVTIKPHPMTEDPDRLWKKIKGSFQSKTVKPLSSDKPIKESHLRCVCISDTHSCTTGLDRKIPPGDVLLHAGDFTMHGDPREVHEFAIFMDLLPHRRKIVIGGNHDIVFDAKFYHPHCTHLMAQFGVPKCNLDDNLRDAGISRIHEAFMRPNLIYLEDTGIDICGIHFHGSPWQPKHYDWGFNIKRGKAILKKWNLIPERTDVLITHGPPLGYGDKVAQGTHVGCMELLSTVRQRVKPKYHVFGHIHEGYGVFSDGQTTFINAAVCNKNYSPCQRPVIFDIPLPPGHTKDELLSDISHPLDPDFWGVPPVPQLRRRDTTGPRCDSDNHGDIELPDNSHRPKEASDAALKREGGTLSVCDSSPLEKLS